MSVKAEAQPVIIPSNAAFIDGREFSAKEGGVVLSDGTHYSIASTDAAYDGRAAELTPEGWQVPDNRVGKMNLKYSTSVSEAGTLGAELEVCHLNREGDYATLKDPEHMNEFSGFMLERASKVASSAEELKYNLQEMVGEAVNYAEKQGQLAAALSVFGQYETTPDQLNPHPYVQHVLGRMSLKTGFDSGRLFAVGGYQAHTGISNSEAGLKVAEAMQSLNPILMTATLAGPLYNGLLGRAELSGIQRSHLQKVGIETTDFQQDYKSWRYLLRNLASPSSGTWKQTAPENLEEYLQLANTMLQESETHTSDRTFGWHTDRFRTIMPNGASTLEDCSSDTALGNPETLLPMHVFRSAITTALEAMAIESQDPVEEVAKTLGIEYLNRQDRLDLANHTALRKASRYGNDARIYGKNPGQWLDTLFALADKSPQFQLSDQHKMQLRRMYATDAETHQAIKKWCRDNNTGTPTAETYFDLGVGSPATYMELQFKEESLNAQEPKQARKDKLIRKVELSAALALHKYVHNL